MIGGGRLFPLFRRKKAGIGGGGGEGGRGWHEMGVG